MENQIIVKLNQGTLKHQVYVFIVGDDSTPFPQDATMEELMSVIVTSAKKHQIKNIKICGPKSFSLGIKNQLTEKISTCFENADNFTIELM